MEGPVKRKKTVSLVSAGTNHPTKRSAGSDGGWHYGKRHHSSSHEPTPVGPRPDNAHKLVHRGEKHYHDHHLSTTLGNEPPHLSNLVWQIHRGVEPGERIGNRIVVTNLNAKLILSLQQLTPHEQLPPPAPKLYVRENAVRVIVFQDRQPTNQETTVKCSDVIDNHPFIEPERDFPFICGFRNRNWLERYQILYDHMQALNFADTGYANVLVPAPGVDDPNYLAAYGVPKAHPLDINLKLDLPVDFGPDIPATTLPPAAEKPGTPVRNGLYLMFIPEHGQTGVHDHMLAHVHGSVRIKFYDV